MERGTYYGFTATPGAGLGMTFTKLTFFTGGQTNGLTAVVLRSSLDGYTANIGEKKDVTPGGSLQTFAGTDPDGLNALSSPSSTAVTFRLYGYGVTDPAVPSGLALSNQDFLGVPLTPGVVVQGTTTPVPEPAALLAAAVGLAAWRRRRRAAV